MVNHNIETSITQIVDMQSADLTELHQIANVKCFADNNTVLISVRRSLVCQLMRNSVQKTD